MFIFDAASVTFTNASTLMLSGLPNNTAYVQYPPSVSAGTFAKVRGLISAQQIILLSTRPFGNMRNLYSLREACIVRRQGAH